MANCGAAEILPRYDVDTEMADKLRVKERQCSIAERESRRSEIFLRYKRCHRICDLDRKRLNRIIIIILIFFLLSRPGDSTHPLRFIVQVAIIPTEHVTNVTRH